MRTVVPLPVDTAAPAFESREAIVAWAAETARQVLTGQLAPSLSAEARQLAGLAMRSHEIQVQEDLANALLTLERGGAAVVLLQQLQTGLAEGKRRPLPPRGVTAFPTRPVPPDGAA